MFEVGFRTHLHNASVVTRGASRPNAVYDTAPRSNVAAATAVEQYCTAYSVN